MTVKAIASALCADSAEAADKTILASEDIYCDEFAAQVEAAWKQVRELKRQRAGLIEIWPGKAPKLNKDFDEALMKLAAELHEKIFEATP